jgi:hypothetical protein
VGLVLAVLAGFALVAALLAWSRWLAGRRWAAAGHLLLTALLALALVGGWPILRYVQTFTPRAPERPVAELFFERIGPGRFRAAVTHLPRATNGVSTCACSTGRRARPASARDRAAGSRPCPHARARRPPQACRGAPRPA